MKLLQDRVGATSVTRLSESGSVPSPHATYLKAQAQLRSQTYLYHLASPSATPPGTKGSHIYQCSWLRPSCDLYLHAFLLSLTQLNLICGVLKDQDQDQPEATFGFCLVPCSMMPFYSPAGSHTRELS